MTSIRVASWPPWYAPNRYIERFHAALAIHDIVHVPNLPLSAKVMVDQDIQIAHLHWAEWAWQSQGTSERRQREGLRALSHFLDDAQGRGLKVVWTVHNLSTHEGNAAIDETGFTEMHGRVALRIFHSEHAERMARARFRGRADGDVIVMPHGNYDDVLPAPTDRRVVRRTLHVPDDAFLLVCAGNVRRYKGFEMVLDAMAATDDERLYVVLEGRCRDESLRQELETVATRLTNVRCCLRVVADQRYADLLNAADAVLLPYREVTGSGALMAALSASRSVIASDLPYFREVTRSEPLAAVFIRDQSPLALLSAIAAHQTTPASERNAAARRLADRCSWEQVVQPVAAWMRRSAGGR